MTEAQTTQCEPGRKGGGDLMLLALVAVVSCVAGMVILGFLSIRAESAVANVLLSTEGCRVAQQLEIKTTPAGSECRLVQPDMSLNKDTLTLADGKHLSRALVVAWTK